MHPMVIRAGINLAEIVEFLFEGFLSYASVEMSTSVMPLCSCHTSTLKSTSVTTPLLLAICKSGSIVRPNVDQLTKAGACNLTAWKRPALQLQAVGPSSRQLGHNHVEPIEESHQQLNCIAYCIP
ncbi:hypothetical protein VNO77_37860 [Canavalia gladiata]|uniref:Uncharacterized protein n=1 Tax=Canavalia gladiata TaxID=3824 RepID=A0AAN9PUY7_CANGL